MMQDITTLTPNCPPTSDAMLSLLDYYPHGSIDGSRTESPIERREEGVYGAHPMPRNRAAVVRYSAGSTDERSGHYLEVVNLDSGDVERSNAIDGSVACLLSEIFDFSTTR